MKAIAVFPLLRFLSEAKEDDLHGADPIKSGARLILEARKSKMEKHIRPAVWCRVL